VRHDPQRVKRRKTKQESEQAMSILDSSRAPAAKFPVIGTNVSGRVTGKPQELQQTDYDSGDPLVWRDGSPRMQWVITVQTDRCDDAEDDGRRRIFAKGQLLKEIRRAVRQARAKDVVDGGFLSVTYIRDGERIDGGPGKPPHVYEATYTPPDDSADEEAPQDTSADEEAIGTAYLGDYDDDAPLF
jgi:hypothetical protein